MATYAIIGGIILVLLAFGGALMFGRKTGQNAQKAEQAEADAKTADRMQDAREAAPAVKADLVKHLREGGRL